MKAYERISIDSSICHGQACIKGTRIPVHLILANGDRVETIRDEYPSLTLADIHACFEYGASLAEEHVTPLETVCRSSCVTKHSVLGKKTHLHKASMPPSSPNN